MRILLAVGILCAALGATGCYMVEYAYDPYYDGYYYEGYRSPSYPVVRYYSPLEPVVDLIILGAMLHNWGDCRPRCYAPSYSPVRRIRR